VIFGGLPADLSEATKAGDSVPAPLSAKLKRQSAALRWF
jgi:hypothetical protein